MYVSRLDYIILKLLESKSAKSPLVGMTINEIEAELDSIAANITLYKRVKTLIKQEYIAKGVKAGKADTFYITDAGIKIKCEGEKNI